MRSLLVRAALGMLALPGPLGACTADEFGLGPGDDPMEVVVVNDCPATVLAYLGPPADEPPAGQRPTVVEPGTSAHVVVFTNTGNAADHTVLFAKNVGGAITMMEISALPLGLDKFPLAHLVGELCPTA